MHHPTATDPTHTTEHDEQPPCERVAEQEKPREAELRAADQPMPPERVLAVQLDFLATRCGVQEVSVVSTGKGDEEIQLYRALLPAIDLINRAVRGAAATEERSGRQQEMR